jgi:RNA polymerase sigma-70 factor (TIGR02960 family)
VAHTLPWMDGADAVASEAGLLAAARHGDDVAFERLVGPYRGRLHAYCYRMLGSVHDADDALQDTLLGAWRGLAGFQQRSSLRSWLYRIATNACLRLASRRPRRMLSADYGPARSDVYDLGEPVGEPIWLEPYPDPPAGPDTDPEAHYQQREHVELALVAALQHLPPTQRAVLILREVLAFSAAEVAQVLDTSVAGVNSALQRARRAIDERVVAGSQQAELRALGERGQRELVAAFVAAWERADVDAMVGLLADDARFGMPPLPAWFLGRDQIVRFMAERAAEFPWRLRRVGANTQLAFALYQDDQTGGPLRLNAINVVTLRAGRISEMTGFLDPEVHRRFGLPERLGDDHEPGPVR